MSTETLDCVVIGAGLSGLTAAWKLHLAGRRVLVLDAADRIGGRLLRQSIAGVPVDGGGAWIGPQQKQVTALVRELGLALRPTYTSGQTVTLLDGVRRAGRGPVPPIPVTAMADAAVAIARLEVMARLLPRGQARYDAVTVGQWAAHHVHTHGARTLIDATVGATTGSASEELSLLALLRLIRSAGSFHQLSGIRGAAQDARLVGGAVALCERLSTRLGGDQVRLRAAAVAITQDADNVHISVPGRSTLTARRAVVAVDPATCARIDFGPGLPAGRAANHRLLTMGSGIKFHLAYSTPFWRESGLNGQAIADDGFTRLLFDATPADDGPGVLVGFLGDFTGTSARHSDLMAAGRAEARAQRVAADVTALLGAHSGAALEYIEQDWRTQPYLSGCVAGERPGVLTATGDGGATPFGRVHWAGAESAVRWRGYMDGAVDAGMRAATEVLAA